MIVSVHLVDVDRLEALRLIRNRPRVAEVEGLTYAEPVLTAPLSGSLLPKPRLDKVGLIAAWDSDESLDGFLEGHPLAARFAPGWRVRLEPVRLFGHWPGMADLPTRERPVDDEEPVAVLTLGRPRLRRLLPFLRNSAQAEEEAAGNPAVLAMTGLARPPHLVSTFSLWRSAAAMREYAFGKAGMHQAAVKADRKRPFHHESAFVRFRPYASQGSWGGRDPLAATS